MWAAPHARGSTRRRAQSADAGAGCPACAGIDPGDETTMSTSRRLPRMRGDRPRTVLDAADVTLAAPHARGSTRCGSSSRDRCAGCPACAGIDPPHAARGLACAWLPRMRGDRPWVRSRLRVMSRAAPHARGSTRRGNVDHRRDHGCPACAGIDPRSRRCSARTVRLPRMRGDRPGPRTSRVALPRAAPHARGSTRLSARVEAPARGCPACAGIDPATCTRMGARPRLPRMRGDRPDSLRAENRELLAAPHARGSTPARLRSL